VKISVALCSFNGERFIAEQLNSILNQTVPVNEIIICDDGSTDKTIEILNDFRTNYPEIIRVFYSNRRYGTIKNFERAISLTGGDIIMLSDQDDIWYNYKVEKIIRTLKSNPDALMVFSNGDLIDANGLKTGSTLWDMWDFPIDVRIKWKDNKIAFYNLVGNNNKVTGATVAFRKELKRHILPIRVHPGYWHDAWLALNAAALNGLIFIEESLIQYRIHSDQQVGISGSIPRIKQEPNFIGSVSFSKFQRIVHNKYPALYKRQNSFLSSFSRLYLFFLKRKPVHNKI